MCIRDRDKEVRVGMIFLYLLLFGGIIAVIIYVIRVGNNENKTRPSAVEVDVDKKIRDLELERMNLENQKLREEIEKIRNK